MSWRKPVTNFLIICLFVLFTLACVGPDSIPGPKGPSDPQDLSINDGNPDARSELVSYTNDDFNWNDENTHGFIQWNLEIFPDSAINATSSVVLAYHRSTESEEWIALPRVDEDIIKLTHSYYSGIFQIDVTSVSRPIFAGHPFTHGDIKIVIILRGASSNKVKPEAVANRIKLIN